MGCSGGGNSPVEPPGDSQDAGCVEPPPTNNPDAGERSDVLAPSRLLRRASLALRGIPPTDAEYAEQDAAAQRAFVDTFVDRTLQQPVFYRTMNGSPMGAPVTLVEESGQRVTRAPRSQDIVATAIRAFGLEPGRDFFIPGGYGVYDGVVRG
ncbi:hypothetical protein [Pyxidicoccus sp. MSG2]|uniref:hypothetical protein n=1 Tax=Pyxidicoccus sp. MSG2 TaxID=2996790 RepID=UPI00226E5D14|nr:hypothetical protein [Pyxidicoccus sp. MSG2]MCY1015775.1 hypothetical protein [Pyxidicoccus sp. MSG2]